MDTTRESRHRRLRLIAAGLLAALVSAACGPQQSSNGSGGTAGDQLASRDGQETQLIAAIDDRCAEAAGELSSLGSRASVLGEPSREALHKLRVAVAIYHAMVEDLDVLNDGASAQVPEGLSAAVTAFIGDFRRVADRFSSAVMAGQAGNTKRYHETVREGFAWLDRAIEAGTAFGLTACP